MVTTRASLSPLAPASAAVIAGLAWGASPLLAGQATIVEVYALNALCFVAMLWLVWRWAEPRVRDAGRLPHLALAGLLFGLGLGNHLTLGLALPGLLIFVWKRRPAGAGFRRELAAAGAAALAGLLVYGYLPLAAAGRPPVNWGDPVTVGRLLWVATGRLYAPLVFGLPLTELPARLAGWATTIGAQLTLPGLLVALLGLWQLDRRLRDWWGATLLIWLAFTVYAIGYNATDSDAYLIPATAVMALWLAEGLGTLLGWFRRPAWLPVAALLFALAAVAVPGYAHTWQEAALSAHLESDAFWRSALAAAEPGAVILTADDRHTFALWYAVYGLRDRSDLALVNVNLYGFDWYRRSLAETHPHLLPSVGAPPRMEELVAGWLRERPVYVVDGVGLPLQLDGPASPDALSRVLSVRN